MARTKVQQSGGFDFAQAAQVVEREEAGVVVPIHDRNGNALLYNGDPVTITVRGVHSYTFRAMADEFRRSYYRQAVDGITDPVERGKALQAAQDNREGAFDEQVRAPNIIAWHGFLDDGEPVEVTPERALEAIRSPFLREQIVLGQEAPERFFSEASDG